MDQTDDDVFDDPRLTDIGILFEATNGIRRRLEPIWSEHGLSVLDFAALMRLGRSPGRRLRMTDLAVQTELSTSGVTRLVDRLERNGFARRQPDPADRRSSYAALTAAGATRLAKVLPEYLKAVDSWFYGPLTPGQCEAMVAGLRAIRDATFPEADRVTE
ncbi:putative transcriptional regulator, MarR family [Nocardia nova SH22a]|uniref:Putative transcriptional regulator, MarR family n=1 Tax=Nocardia nova SH22a TaxID=1415166 RepID=W5TRN5_9NOCA|nr:MarR family transcriptional regulator [Nocardia nova]AHH21603.1 putative transcriptional regulator, MarR family [Nocardia nova SH22a]